MSTPPPVNRLPGAFDGKAVELVTSTGFGTITGTVIGHREPWVILTRTDRPDVWVQVPHIVSIWLVP